MYDIYTYYIRINTHTYVCVRDRYNLYNIKDTARHSYKRLRGIVDEMQHIKNGNTRVRKRQQRCKRALWRSAVLKGPRMNTVP